MKKKTLSIAAFLLTGTLFFAGCGQTADGNSNANASGQETSVTGQVSADTENSSDNADADLSFFSDMNTTDLDGNKVDSSIFSDNKVTLVNVWNVDALHASTKYRSWRN